MRSSRNYMNKLNPLEYIIYCVQHIELARKNYFCKVAQSFLQAYCLKIITALVLILLWKIYLSYRIVVIYFSWNIWTSQRGFDHNIKFLVK